MTQQVPPGDRREAALLRSSAALSPSIEPDRDLWPEIAAGIRRCAPARAARPWWQQLAAAAVLVTVSSTLTYLVLLDRTPVSQNPMAPLHTQPASFGGQYTLGPGYSDARAELVVTLDGRLPALSEETRQLVEKNLRDIRSALSQINAALAEDPNNVLLQQLLLSAYQDELATLTNVNGISTGIPLRNDI